MKNEKSKFLVPQCLSALAPFKKSAFTLAEVLITLAIIGVVAAMTIPTLIAKYDKKFTETSLVKFYSIMNNAIQLSSIENGLSSSWAYINSEYDEDNNVFLHDKYLKNDEFAEKYLLPYLKIIKKEVAKWGNDNVILYYLTDGSSFCFTTHSSKDIFFFPKNGKDCLAKGLPIGECGFSYYISEKHNGLKVYDYNWNGTRESLFNNTLYGCGNSGGMYCTKLIEINNWKIPEDYPVEISY